MTIETSLERILYSNQSGDIAEELFDLLVRAVKPGFDLDDALSVIYPRLDHCDASRAQYIAERGRVLSVE